MQGASAIHEVLAKRPDVRVFVIWEPVLATDLSAPGDDARARVPEALQYWDSEKSTAALFQPVLSRAPEGIVGKSSLVTGKVLWDFVGVYPPGATWSAEPPMPSFRGAPVVDVRDALLHHLGGDAKREGLVSTKGN